MAEENMPAAEANHYEFAFHVLPTVAEGEVSGVFDEVKAHITKFGGAVTVEEMPKRIDLAYSIMKPIEGKNRKFASAYFGWVRFTAVPAVLPELTEELELMPSILRSITVKLTRIEEERPFFYHEAVASVKKVSVYEEKEVARDAVVDDAAEEVVEDEVVVEAVEKVTQ
jgi:ribosomal protein S6